MRLKIVNGIGNPPLEVDATMVVCEDINGTPIMVAGHYGPDQAIRASHAMDNDFNDTLKKLGVHKTVICDRLALPPPPPGARLIRDPKSGGFFGG